MTWLLDVAFVVGACLVVAGVALVFVPAALVVAGVLVASIAWFVHGGAR